MSTIKRPTRLVYKHDKKSIGCFKCKWRIGDAFAYGQFAAERILTSTAITSHSIQLYTYYRSIQCICLGTFVPPSHAPPRTIDFSPKTQAPLHYSNLQINSRSSTGVVENNVILPVPAPTPTSNLVPPVTQR